MFDPRIARFFTKDPRETQYPWQSTFVCSANNPINLIDVNGEGPGKPGQTRTKDVKIVSAVDHQNNTFISQITTFTTTNTKADGSKVVSIYYTIATNKVSNLETDDPNYNASTAVIKGNVVNFNIVTYYDKEGKVKKSKMTSMSARKQNAGEFQLLSEWTNYIKKFNTSPNDDPSTYNETVIEEGAAGLDKAITAGMLPFQIVFATGLKKLEVDNPLIKGGIELAGGPTDIKGVLTQLTKITSYKEIGLDGKQAYGRVLDVYRVTDGQFIKMPKGTQPYVKTSTFGIEHNREKGLSEYIQQYGNMMLNGF
jgi:hypothetical protein